MKYQFLFFVFLILNSSQAQTGIITKDSNRFIYDDKSYTIDEIELVLSKNYISHSKYKQGRIYNKISKIVAASGFVLGISGTIMLGAGVHKPYSSDNWSKRIAITGIFTSFLAIIPRIIGTENINSAINTYNFEILKSEGYKSNVSISFDGTENGLGFVFKF